MMTRWLSIAGLAVATTACGGGVDSPTGTPDAAAAGSGSDNQPAVTYEGKIASVPPVTFGVAPFCAYTQTVSNLVLDLLIKPNGTVIGGAMQHHNVEACPAGDIAPQPPSDVSYTLTGTQPSGDGTQLTFTGAASNRPNTTLTIQLTPAGTAYNAALTIHRIDQPANPSLDWTVTATVQITAKP
jgi:hypothetical protein